MVSLVNITTELMNINPEECLKCINEEWNKIPIFGRVPCSQFKEGEIVRFRGMIQDMANPIFYFSKFQVKNEETGQISLKYGKYLDSHLCKDTETLIFDPEVSETKERRMFHMVSVPSLNEWAQVKVEPQVSEITSSEERVGLAETSVSKRTYEEMQIDDHSSKRVCPNSTESENKLKNPEMAPSVSIYADDVSCLLMLYDVPDDQIKLNEVIEVSGFLYQSPLILQDDDHDTMYIPPSPLIPRLHAISYRKVNQLNPLLEPNNSGLYNEIVVQASSLRSELHSLLTQLLLGDSLVADYLICHLLSQVYFRDEALALGKLSLNIFNFPVDYSSKKLYNIISRLLPKTCYVPLSLENLNTSTFLPGKNYKTGRLERGILQLSDHTHLVLDETKLTEGKLAEKGVKNVYALKSLINKQALDYDFHYYTLQFKTDIPVLIFSQSPSVLPFDAQIPLKHDFIPVETIEETFDGAQSFLSGPLSDKIRLYLSVAPSIPFDLPEEFQTLIQDYFVTLRQQDSTATAEDLHELLVLARFLSVSYGQTRLNIDIWKKAKSLVSSRKARTKK